MARGQKNLQTEIPALRVNQWLPIWDEYTFSRPSNRARPLNHFFVLSMKASVLRALSGVNRRTREKPGIDLGIQRRHEKARSEEIAQYVQYGYPYSIMSKARRERPKSNDFRQPGWLATAIIVNIMKASDKRRGVSVNAKDLVHVVDAARPLIRLPESYSGEKWEPVGRHPMEVIDGQHRLFAFDDPHLSDFDVPVVAFNGLDIGWQAYLFWTINIKPKKINASLAFDLYPLLSSQSWLEEGEDYAIYRETRAQEIVEKLWAFKDSVWHQRIDMVGDAGRQFVSQAAWVRTLMASFIKRPAGKGVSIGGLFGSKMSETADPLPWSRMQQAAFIITFWNRFAVAVKNATGKWAKDLRASDDAATTRFTERAGSLDPAFYGPHTLINQDQGVRAILHVLNDVFVVAGNDLDLESWTSNTDDDLQDDDALTEQIRTLGKAGFFGVLKSLCGHLAEYDWRSSTAPGLSDADKQMRRLYRGSGGYAELRRQCIDFLGSNATGPIKKSAKVIASKLRALQ